MSRDLRKYAGQTNVRFILGGLLVILIVGIGLIYVFFDVRAALMGLMCMVIGISILIIIWFSLWLMEKIVHGADQE
jgi:Na+/phosphate symporter